MSVDLINRDEEPSPTGIDGFALHQGPTPGVRSGDAGKIGCPLCGAFSPPPFFVFDRMPVFCNILWKSEEEARLAPSSCIELTACPHCAMVYNQAFNPRLVEYAPAYENALHFSERFRTYADELSERLVATYSLKGGGIVEIGSGDGYFLERLVARGVATAIGYDPSMAGKPVPSGRSESVRILAEPFVAATLPDVLDAVICRHAIEHLEAPMSFMESLRATLAQRTPLVFFEAPNATWMLGAPSPWDVIYEHFTYWSAPTLRHLFEKAGFEPLRVATGFGDQFVMIDARPDAARSSHATDDREARSNILNLCASFAEKSDAALTACRAVLADLAARHGRAVIWGAGSKGVTFANALGDVAEGVAGLVDISPRKHGKFIGGCAKPVVAPEALLEIQPDLVLLLNGNYFAEVAAQLNELGLAPHIHVVVR